MYKLRELTSVSTSTVPRCIEENHETSVRISNIQPTLRPEIYIDVKQE
jgi:hypothetical protein